MATELKSVKTAPRLTFTEEDLETLRKNLQSDIDGLRDELLQARKELQTAQDKARKTDVEQKELSQKAQQRHLEEVQVHAREAAVLRTRLEETSGLLQKREAALNDAVQDQLKAKQEAADAKLALQGLQQEIRALQSELDRAKSQWAAKDQETAKLGADRDALSREVDKLREKIAVVEGKLAYLTDFLPVKLAKTVQFYNEKLVFRLPKIATLYAVNLATTTYLEWWEGKYKKKIFP